MGNLFWLARYRHMPMPFLNWFINLIVAVIEIIYRMLAIHGSISTYM